MALELHPLRFELQIWFSHLLWALKQTHGASSLEIQTGNFADISDLGFLFYFLCFFSEKNQNLLDIQEHCICKLGKIRS